jgi:hypothetical protein
MCVMQRRSGQLIHLLYLVAYILLDIQETAKYTSRHKKEVLINSSAAPSPC